MLLPRLPLPAGVGQGRRHPSLIPSPCAGQSALYTSAGRQNRAKRKIRLPSETGNGPAASAPHGNENTKDMPPIKIYKFGGASVRSAEGVENLARIVAAEPRTTTGYRFGYGQDDQCAGGSARPVHAQPLGRSNRAVRGDRTIPSADRPLTVRPIPLPSRHAPKNSPRRFGNCFAAKPAGRITIAGTTGS